MVAYRDKGTPINIGAVNKTIYFTLTSLENGENPSSKSSMLSQPV